MIAAVTHSGRRLARDRAGLALGRRGRCSSSCSGRAPPRRVGRTTPSIAGRGRSASPSSAVLPVAAVVRRPRRRAVPDDVGDDGPRRRVRRVPRRRRARRPRCSTLTAVERVPAPPGHRSQARVPRAPAVLGGRHARDDDGERPDRRVRRARDRCRSRCTCSPPSTAAGCRSLEAGIKYFVLGAFSSAIFLYGIALVYGATGTTSLTGIADVPRRTSPCSRTARCSPG